MVGLKVFRNLCIGSFVACALAAAVIFGIAIGRGQSLDVLEIGGGGTVSTDSFIVKDLLPGKSCEYDVKLTATENGRLTVKAEQGSNLSLAPFLVVTALRDGQQTFCGTFAEFLENAGLDGDVGAGDTVGVTVRYTLPASTGNEAQGASLDFRLVFRLEEAS